MELPILGQGADAQHHGLVPKTHVDKVNEATIQLIAQEYTKGQSPWFVGYSGGKDSSVLLVLLYMSLLQVKQTARLSRDIFIIYCDTGVEIPTVSSHVRGTMKRLVAEAENSRLPIRVRVARPPVEDSFFVKVIGRGYPPPTNKFRWCTDRLRINPIQRLIASESESSTVLLGVRRGESPERDRVLDRHQTDRDYFQRQTGRRNTEIFCPILNYSHSLVWSTLLLGRQTSFIDTARLRNLYRESSGECPIVRDPNSSPCSKGRFGCWTCTVIRRDKSMMNLISEGHSSLQPLLDWKRCLLAIRDNPHYRYKKRRNGVAGLGPLTLRARKLLLKKLLDAEQFSGRRLISRRELKLIYDHWRNDTMITSTWDTVGEFTDLLPGHGQSCET